jgi:hypothetical protein
MNFKNFLNKSPVCITSSWFIFYKQKYLCLSNLQFMPTEWRFNILMRHQCQNFPFGQSCFLQYEDPDWWSCLFFVSAFRSGTFNLYCPTQPYADLLKVLANGIPCHMLVSAWNGNINVHAKWGGGGTMTSMRYILH